MEGIPLVHNPPPIYERLHNRFHVDWETGVIIAYDGKIYSKDTIAPQKVIHEKVHLDRQKDMGNDAWWNLYIDSDVFRFEEELLAYRAEAKFIKKNIKNREDRFQMIRHIAKDFSSSIYGNLVSTNEALQLIQ